MEKSRKTNKIIVILLLLLIAGLSIGFAAFDADLIIRSGATVTPNPDGFAVVLSAESTSAKAGAVTTTGKANAISITGTNTTTIEGLKADFTEPGQEATWTFYAFNSGLYDAYLNDVTIGDVTYTIDEKEGTDENKVKEAIKGIKVSVSVNSVPFERPEDGSAITVNTHSLQKGHGEEIVVTVEYESGSAIADGDFTVNIGDIVLGYDSIDTGLTTE